jgi:hypothetical protein
MASEGQHVEVLWRGKVWSGSHCKDEETPSGFLHLLVLHKSHLSGCPTLGSISTPSPTAMVPDHSSIVRTNSPKKIHEGEMQPANPSGSVISPVCSVGSELCWFLQSYICGALKDNSNLGFLLPDFIIFSLLQSPCVHLVLMCSVLSCRATIQSKKDIKVLYN